MTPEELEEWRLAAVEESRRRFAGQPLPPIRREKLDDYPHLERSGWGFALEADAPVRIWRDPDASAQEGAVVALRPVVDGGPLALVVRDGEGQIWALRRRDGYAAWAERPTHRWATTRELRIRVTAWPVDDASTTAEQLPAPHDEHEWLVQSAQLGKDDKA
jgi:hypothetical protein